MSGRVERKVLACPSLQLAGCLAVSHPAPTHSPVGFALVLAVSKLLFRPRVWPGRTQVFGLPELAISWCLAVSHPAPVPFTRWFCLGFSGFEDAVSAPCLAGSNARFWLAQACN